MAHPFTDSEQLWYLDFSENQHLQALANLSETMVSPKLKAYLLRQEREIDVLIKRRRRFLQDLL